MNEEERELLLDIFENTEAPEKIKIILDPLTRDVTIVYEDLDDEWFRELQAAQQGRAADGAVCTCHQFTPSQYNRGKCGVCGKPPRR